MAGLGFKDFAVGEVLTSADVDGYLMQQTVMRFPDAGARGSALGTAVGTGVPLAEGMVTYLDDENSVQVYDGASWISSGGLVAVKHALFTGTQTNSTGAGANFAVTDLTITHTMQLATNRLILMAYFGTAGNSEGAGNCGIAFADNGVLIGIGDAASSRTRLGAGAITTGGGGGSTSATSSPHIHLVHTPGDAASHTYTVRAVNQSTVTQTLYINRSQADANTAGNGRSVSAITLMEVRP